MLRERKKLDLCWNREEVAMRSVSVDFDFFGYSRAVFVGSGGLAVRLRPRVVRVLDFHGFDVSNYLSMLTPLVAVFLNGNMYLFEYI